MSKFIERLFGCPYCGGGLSEEWSACCGEAGHGEYLYFTEDGDEATEAEFLEQQDAIKACSDCKKTVPGGFFQSIVEPCAKHGGEAA
jgi:RNA polymerase subunit RPABC4/transcription elongation factor Spt4